jgi:hypothetical protein
MQTNQLNFMLGIGNRIFLNPACRAKFSADIIILERRTHKESKTQT